MQREVIISLAFWLFRILAIVQVVVGIIGLLWFADYYFSIDNLWNTVIAATPIIALLLGVFSPNRFLSNSRGFWIALAILLMGCVFVFVQMYGDLTLINGPDYGAFKARLITFSLIVVFVLRTLYCKK